MPIIDRQDASEVGQYIDRFFAATGTGRAQALRRLFVEKLDFANATGVVSLSNVSKNVALPPQAERIASIEGLHVVYVPLSAPGPDRVRKEEVVAAAKILTDTLHGDLLLVMTNPLGSQLHVIYPTFVGTTPSLRRMVIERDLPRRTAVQQLSEIFHEWNRTGSIGLAVDKAFDVEAVTKQFFEEYKRVFDNVMIAVEGFGRTEKEEEAKKLFVQTLFNRLMFVYFLSRKGWLKFNGDSDYLQALRKDYPARSEDKNFYANRLTVLFFAGLNNDASRDVRSPSLTSLIGDVPFLNGGLFDETDVDKRQNLLVPDSAIDQILRQLFDRFNFTVMESTPFDVEVAVDPEMLGKVFEELVTGRHKSGSYYTPRPVVSFMCREALKGYLETENTGASNDAIKEFIDHQDTTKLDLSTAPKISAALARVKVVDPACGSGAYLLGMMLELVELMTALYSTQLSHEEKDLYNLKLQIIENNLHGADLDQFAINIAMLRLWLSLAIEYDGDVTDLSPLPNLDFKMVCGDSLLGPDPSPDNYGNLFRHRIHELAGQVAQLKQKHMRETGSEKLRLAKDIESIQGSLREALVDSSAPGEAIDWRVEFAEVFDQNGGFDITIMNPPFVATYSRQSEKMAIGTEQQLKNLYGGYGGRINLFTCFIVRSLQIASPKGAAAFIVPDSYATSDSYGQVRAVHRQRFSRQSWTLIKPPVFGANVRNVIVVASPGDQQLRAVVVEDEEDLSRLGEMHLRAQDTLWGSNCRIPFFSSIFEQQLWKRLSIGADRLKDRFETRDGVNPGPRSVRNRIINPNNNRRGIRPLIVGSHIDNRGFRVRPSDQTILYNPAEITAAERKAGASLRDPSIFLSPKIVSRQTADTIIAAIDLDGDFVALNSVHCTRSLLGSLVELWGLLALLNCPLARLYYAIDGGETRELLPQVHISWLMEFPLPHHASEVLAKLAPVAMEVHKYFDRDQCRQEGNFKIHQMVCTAYGLNCVEQDAVVKAYLSRYPRYVADLPLFT